jgi:V/A-type H+-transporting ATPase subunit E
MEKIQELTDKIRREGVEKGQEEAARIIAEAKQQAEKIVADAKVQAEAIAQKAKKDAKELDQNTKSELKLYMAQALNALKSEITNVVTDKVVGQSVKKLADDKDFLGRFTVALATEWVKQENIVISTEDAEALKAYFAREAKALLDKGVKIEKVSGRQALFTVQPADGSYRVDFGKEELEAYFKAFLRPQLIEMLF